MVHDLLVDPLLSWRDAGHRRAQTTLPGVLARLATGELSDFPRVRPHQLEPWCMFLTQLAAIALRRAGKSDPRQSEEDWRQLLLALTQGQNEGWTLVVDDLSKGAFFQPPVPEGSIESWNECEFPDDVDVLRTAKSHDVKRSLLHGDEGEPWVYSLCTLQTTQGYFGAGYTWITRMNGAYGNRARLGLSSDQALASRFRRDVTVLLESWERLLQRGYREDGVALVWLEPWDGNRSLAMHDLAPHFVEICWRIRCRAERAAITCAYTTVKARRCIPEVSNGDVGDPWIPVARDGKALTVAASGFNYRLLSKVLFENDFEPAAAQVPRLDDGDPVFFIGSALARGQGRTEGLHQRTIRLAGEIRRRLGIEDAKATVGVRSARRVASVSTMRSRVLFPALKQLSAGGVVPSDSLDDRVDEMFFEHLSETLSMSDEDARVTFERRVAEIAWDELQRAIEHSSAGDAKRLRAITAAERTFQACLRKHFPDATQTASEEASI
jgi:CRISPR system Cascade subunit CasA